MKCLARLILPACALAMMVTLAGGDTVFRSRSRLVHLTVLALDQKGNPVTNLTKDDFTIFDEGQPEPVQFFMSPLSPAPPLTTVQSSARELAKDTVYPAATFSNRIFKPGKYHTIILLDIYNTPMSNQKYAIDQVKDYLRNVKPEEDIAVYVLGKKLKVVQDLTNNKEQLEALAANLKPVASVERDPGAMDGILRAIENTSTVSLEGGYTPGTSKVMVGYSYYAERDQFLRMRMRDTVNTIKTVAQRLAGLPGPKNVIWISGGMPFTVTELSGDRDDWPTIAPSTIDLQAPWSQTLEALSMANIAVYPVDSRGFTGELADDNKDTMRAMATATGGKAYLNTNDLTGAIHQAMDDSHAAYELAFAPTHNRWDGSFRKIKIQVKQPGIKLRYRGGYLARSDSELTDHQRLFEMGNIALGPVDATGIGLAVERQSQRVGEKNRDYVTLNLVMDPKELEYRDDKGQLTADMDLLFVAMNPKAKILCSIRQSAQVQLLPGKEPQQLTALLKLKREYEIAKNTARLRVVIRDRNSGRMGSVEVPLTTLAANTR